MNTHAGIDQQSAVAEGSAALPRATQLYLDATYVPIARDSDPESSHEAAREITQSGARMRQLEIVLNAVRERPGCTSLELSTRIRLDRYAVARRLPELESAGLIRRGEIRLCSVGERKGITWYAEGK